MSDTEIKQKSKPINFNTFLHVIVFGAVTWVGTTLRENVKELSAVREKIAVIESVNQQKVDQLTRIENRQTTQQEQINNIQIELVRLKKP